jgi:hypothetical protein
LSSECYYTLEPREAAGTPGDRMYPAGGWCD